MNTLPTWPRLVLAIVLMVVLSLVFNLAEGGLPTRDEMPTLVVGSIFLLVIYSFVITCFGFAAGAMGFFGIPPWTVFCVLFVGMSAGWLYFSLTLAEIYEIAGQSIVVGHHLTPHGWTYWCRNVAESTVQAVIAAAILFGRRSANRFQPSP